jgi:hypothetical protein
LIHAVAALGLCFVRCAVQVGDAAAPQDLGQPVVVRQMTRVPHGLASLRGGPDSSLPLPQPITVRIYLSGSSDNSTGSAASADTAVAAAGGAAAAAAAAPAAPAPRLQGKARLQARLRALDQMSRRVAKAAQTIVKGVPTPLPSHKQVTDAAQQARPAGGGGAAGGGGHGNGVTSPTAGQRQQQGQQQQQLGSSHASGLHRLARGSAVNYSPFHHKRPHPADSEASSSGSSGGCLLLAVDGCWVLDGC